MTRVTRPCHDGADPRDPTATTTQGFPLPAPISAPIATALRPVRGREYQLLTEAHRARKRGRGRAALRLYKRILIESPRNLEIALRVAPLLAWSGNGFEAWQLYRRVARELARRGQLPECLTVYREACRFVPHEFEAWRLCAELQIKLKRPEGAFETLIEGRTHFDTPQTRGQAIALLSRAREIEPWDDPLLIDLARLYADDDQPEMALELLSILACRVAGRMLRRVRALQLRITLSPLYLGLWLRAFGRDDSPVTAAASRRPSPMGGRPAQDEARPVLREVGAGAPLA